MLGMCTYPFNEKNIHLCSLHTILSVTQQYKDFIDLYSESPSSENFYKVDRLILYYINCYNVPVRLITSNWHFRESGHQLTRVTSLNQNKEKICLKKLKKDRRETNYSDYNSKNYPIQGISTILNQTIYKNKDFFKCLSKIISKPKIKPNYPILLIY